MPGVMIVVVPLRAIFAARRLLRGVEQAGAVVAVFQHEMDMPPGRVGELSGGDAEIVQHRDFAGLGQDVVGRIEPQPVEAIVAQPMQRVLDRESAHLAARDSRSRCPRACARR